jgi:hypothetical protein
VVFVVQWLFAPLGPRQIVERFLEAKTDAESKRYVTERMYPLFNLPDTPSNAGDEIVITGESAVLGRKDEYHVGAWAKFFEPSVGRRMEMECVFQLMSRKGTWAIDDFFVLRVDGELLERPVSILELLPNQRGLVPKSSMSDDAYRQARSWFDTNPKSKMLGGLFALNALKSGAFKSIAVCLIAIVAAVAAWPKRRRSA